MTKLGYRKAIQWIADYDDTQFLDDPNGIESVTVVFAAHVFGQTVEKVVADLRKVLEQDILARAALAKARGAP